jgi:DNA-binding MurR/RpiR family transcriptional regulator
LTQDNLKVVKGLAVQREKSFLARIREALPGMHRAERKLGEMLCDFPGELASYSAAELAALSGVSTATVSRFVRRLGYASYEEARVKAREEREIGSRLYLVTPESSEPDRRFLDVHFEHYARSLESTASGIDDETIDAIVEAILSARRVWTIGFRASHSFATYMRWQLLQVLEFVDAIPGGGQTMGEHIVSFADADLAIVFGLRRRVAETDAILDEIARKGTKIVYITDEGAPLRSDVTWHLRCSTSSPGPLFNHVPVMAVSHLVIDQVISRAAASGRLRLREIETIHDALNEV